MKSSLRQVLERLGGIAGSIHRTSGDFLCLVDQTGLPDDVVQIIERVPRGKGMAGQAWLTGKPITTCNIKTDSAAPIEPGARSVLAKASIAVPIFDDQGDAVSVIGFAFSDDQPFDEMRIDICRQAAYHLWSTLDL